MNIILDTNVILWWLEDSPFLKKLHKEKISDSQNLCFISAASIWEIAIKSSIGKLDIPSNYLTLLKQQGFIELSITWVHAQKVLSLPMMHRDPFDRMLIAQSMIEGYAILSTDINFKKYKAHIIG